MVSMVAGRLLGVHVLRHECARTVLNSSTQFSCTNISSLRMHKLSRFGFVLEIAFMGVKWFVHRVDPVVRILTRLVSLDLLGMAMAALSWVLR